MAVKGKKKYQLYLDQENVEFLKSYLDNRKHSGGLSGLVDKYLARCVWMIKSNQDIFRNIKPGKMTFRSFWELVKLQFRLEMEKENCDIEKEMKDKQE